MFSEIILINKVDWINQSVLDEHHNMKLVLRQECLKNIYLYIVRVTIWFKEILSIVVTIKRVYSNEFLDFKSII